MAELATIARPYAEALFKVAQKGDVKSWSGQVEALANVAADPQLRVFADNPKVLPAQVFDVLTAAANQPLDPGMQNFLRAVIDNGRLAALPEIIGQFHALVNASSGVSDAKIFSAYPLDQAQLADVVGVLEKRFGRKLAATVEVEPALIGGIRVVVGDEALDTSVKARLERMKAALTA
jgi:F-type H+-transporting ATPase subunit delta